MAIGSTTSAAAPRPMLTRWLVPSVGDSLFVALLALLAFTNLSVRLLGDAGIGWHIRTGQLILAAHAVPHTDPFSSSLHGEPWFAWEWLYDVKVGWWDSAAGLNGVVVFTALIIALTFSGTFFLLLRRGTNVLVALALVLLAASASMIHFLARPHVVSWLFTVTWFWILESSLESSLEPTEDRRTWRLWLLPPLMLVWVNVHGGFLVGFALLAIYWMSAAWQWSRLKEDRFEDALRKIHLGRRVRILTSTGGLSAITTLVNPYGFHLHLHIYRYLSNRFLMDHIDEFQSPNFHLVAQKCFAGLLLLTLLALAAKRREARVSENLLNHGLLILFAVYAGLYAARNIPVSSLLLILAIGPWLSETLERFSGRRSPAAQRHKAFYQFLQRMQATEVSMRGHLWPLAAVALSFWIAVHNGNIVSTPSMNAHFDAKRFPVQAVDYLVGHDVKGPILSPDYWGGYLIYRLYPRVQVVVDDRHDFYGETFLQSYLKMIHLEPSWRDFIEQHPARYLLLQKDSPLANLLLETGWQPIYNDDVAVLFVETRVKQK